MDKHDLSNHLKDPARLTALRAVALLDTPTEEAFDRLTWLATRAVHAPVSLVSLVDADRQFFKSCVGIPEPWLSQRETPLTHSFCQYNRVAGEPLLVEDARVHPLFKTNLAIGDLRVVAYLGIPLVSCDGYVLGSFCVIDSKPRKWTEEEVLIVKKLSDAVMTEIQLRTEAAARAEAEERQKAEHEALLEMHHKLKEKSAKLERESTKRLKVLEQLRLRDHMLLQQSRLAAMGEMISNIAHQWRQPLNLMALIVQEMPLAYERGEFSSDYLDKSVNKMMASISHMSETIDNFRNFFNPEKERVDFCVAEMVAKALALLNSTFNSSKIQILVSGCKPIINGFPKEYSQVVLNILMNAIEAFSARKISDPSIDVNIGTDGSRSVVSITDNAGGIPDDIMDKIFDPYFTTKAPDKGTGIGLYMSKMIIEKSMGGALTACNVDGGARFRIVV